MTTCHPRGLPASLGKLDRALVMGILNVTPDSFSDGGRWLDGEVAVAHGIALHRHGADLVDVGGESTRPGATRVPVAEELRRVLSVVTGLVEAGVPVSIDTMRAAVAEAAVAAGACLINDVSGGLGDPAMADVLASLQVPYVLMHWRGTAATMADLAHYDDVVRDVAAELEQRLAATVAAGVDVDRIVLDPGLGFAKTVEHNWALLQRLDVFVALGRPLLLGASRKRFLGALLADSDGPRPVTDRDQATDAISALAAGAGAWCVRVHDVRGTADAVRVAAAWRRGSAAAADSSPGRAESVGVGG